MRLIYNCITYSSHFFLFCEGTSLTDAEYADSLMGILVVQDIQLGALIAMMPLLCLQSYNSKALDKLLKGGFILCSTLLLLMLMCRLMSLLVIDRLFRFVWNFIKFCVCVCKHFMNDLLYITLVLECLMLLV